MLTILVFARNGPWMLSLGDGELFEVECEPFGYAIYDWQSNFLIQRERKNRLGKSRKAFPTSNSFY